MSQHLFNIQNFIKETKDIIIQPKQYFMHMKKTGGFTEPVLKVAIYGFLSSLITYVLMKTGFLMSSFVFFGTNVMEKISFASLIFTPLGYIIALFIISIFLMLISSISNGSRDYETSLRIMASLFVLSPISSLLKLLSNINPTLVSIGDAVLSIYGLWLMYNALIYTLKAKEATAKVISIILAIFPALTLAGGLMCKKSINYNFGQPQHLRQRMIPNQRTVPGMQQRIPGKSQQPNQKWNEDEARKRSLEQNKKLEGRSL
jgi:hypothetical protein